MNNETQNPEQGEPDADSSACSGLLCRVYRIDWRGERVYAAPTTREAAEASIAAARAMGDETEYHLEPVDAA